MPAQPRLSEDLRSYLYAEAGVRVTAESISLDDCRSYADALRTTAQILIDEGRLSMTDLPYHVGPKYNLLASTPRHQDGIKMLSPTEVSEGVYMECNFSQDRIRRLIDGLVNEFGTYVGQGSYFAGVVVSSNSRFSPFSASEFRSPKRSISDEYVRQ